MVRIKTNNNIKNRRFIAFSFIAFAFISLHGGAAIPDGIGGEGGGSWRGKTGKKTTAPGRQNRSGRVLQMKPYILYVSQISFVNTSLFQLKNYNRTLLFSPLTIM